MALSLTYHTKANSSTVGKKHVYLSGHPDDLKQYQEAICSLIYESHNCVVSHLDTKFMSLMKTSEEELQFLLENANGIFVLVTKRFLNEASISSDTELPYLIRKHIPFLPLFLEPELETTFSLKFHSRHGVSTVTVDPTGIPFRQKILTFLTNTLGTAEENERIRSVFRHHVFLSYRKKDRIRANAIIRRLHDDPQLDNTAVWFDEFLDPGTDFNNAIVQKLREAELVLFVVADSWLEKDNYIERIEYKETVKLGKPFYAVKFGRVDNGLLEKQYPGISNHFISIPALTKQVKKSLQLPRSISIESAHDLYLLSLAYFRGYYVATDHTKGRRLLETAAQKKDMDAICTLAGHHRTGFYGETDPKRALELYQEALSIHKSLLLSTNHIDRISEIFDIWEEIITLYRSTGDERSYRAETEKQLSFFEDYMYRNPSFQQATLLIFIYNSQGDYYLDLQDTDTARLYYQKMEKIQEFIKNTPALPEDASCGDEEKMERQLQYRMIQVLLLYNRGLIAYATTEYDQAISWFTQVIAELRSFGKLAKYAAFRTLQGGAYQHLGKIYKQKEQYSKASAYFDKAMNNARLSIQEEPEEKEHHILAMQIGQHQCDVLIHSGKYKKAEQKLLDLQKICLRYEEKWSDDNSFSRLTSQTMMLLAQFYYTIKKWDLAEEYFKKAFNQITTRKHAIPTHEDLEPLYTILHLLADLHLQYIEQNFSDSPDDDDYPLLSNRLDEITSVIECMHRLHFQIQEQLLVRICHRFFEIADAYQKRTDYSYARQFLHQVLFFLNSHSEKNWSTELVTLWIDTALKYHEVLPHCSGELSFFFIDHFTFEIAQEHPDLLQNPKFIKLLILSLVSYPLAMSGFTLNDGANAVSYAYICAGMYILETYRTALSPYEYLATKLNTYILSLQYTALPVRYFIKEAIRIAQTLSTMDKESDWQSVLEKLESIRKKPLFTTKLFFKKQALSGLVGIHRAGFRRIDLFWFILRL